MALKSTYVVDTSRHQQLESVIESSEHEGEGHHIQYISQHHHLMYNSSTKLCSQLYRVMYYYINTRNIQQYQVGTWYQAVFMYVSTYILLL